MESGEASGKWTGCKTLENDRDRGGACGEWRGE